MLPTGRENMAVKGSPDPARWMSRKCRERFTHGLCRNAWKAPKFSSCFVDRDLNQRQLLHVLGRSGTCCQRTEPAVNRPLRVIPRHADSLKNVRRVRRLAPAYVRSSNYVVEPRRIQEGGEVSSFDLGLCRNKNRRVLEDARPGSATAWPTGGTDDACIQGRRHCSPDCLPF